MFQPPSESEIFSDVSEAIRHFGHLPENSAFWLSTVLSQLWLANPERTVIQIGEPLEAGELAKLNLPRWTTIGCEAWEKLSDQGRSFRLEGFVPTITRAMRRWHLNRDHQKMRRCLARGFPFEHIEVIATIPFAYCRDVQSLFGKKFESAQSLPTLPVGTCDCDQCFCRYRPASGFENLNDVTK